MEKPGFLVRCYRIADNLYSTAAGAMDALHRGIWLGLMSPSHLDRATAAYYRSSKRYIDAEYNSQGLREWERRAIGAYYSDCRRLLVAAAGGGREVIALCQRGFLIEACDTSPEFVASCQELLASKQLEADVSVCPPGRVPEGDTLLDGAVIGWGGYMHIIGRGDRIAFLASIRARMAPGGPVLLSFLTRPPDSRRFRWQWRVASLVRHLRFSGDPVELGDTVATSFDHHFVEEEIVGELRAAGFEPASVITEPYGHAVGIATQIS